MTLEKLVSDAARTVPEQTAIETVDGSISYGALDRQSNRIGRLLRELGVEQGDRVGVWLNKTIDAVATLQAVLRLGAAYVPVDPSAPKSRAVTIFRDCEVSAVVTTDHHADTALSEELQDVPRLLTDGTWNGVGWKDVEKRSGDPLEAPENDEDDLAYILYTSGSTGKPKGVCISHKNALSFVEWAVDELNAGSDDRFVNHAPFHFDLSVLDLYGTFQAQGTVGIIPKKWSFLAERLVQFVLDYEPTIWYSVPSALTLMIEQGGVLEIEDVPMDSIIFAGEPFPIAQLRKLQRAFPDVHLYNFYGPTETNVCTYYEVPGSVESRDKPVPIGKACSGNEVWAVDDGGNRIEAGEKGELIVDGPTVMLGYWGREPQGDEPYATGDIVRLLSDGNYEYVGRKDNMVKVRGHRVELEEVEAALEAHASIREAVVVVEGSGLNAKLSAVIVPEAGGSPNLLDIKSHCADRVPRYMIVDRVRRVEDLPRSDRGKVDREELKRRMSEPETNE